MKLSKRNKVGLAVFGLVTAALIVDRVFLGSGLGPDVAVAAASQLAPGPTLRLAVEAPVAAERRPQRNLAERLQALAKAQQLAEAPDAFGLSEAWMADIAPKATAQEQLTPAEEFAKRYQLQAVVVTGQVNSAVVNGVCLSVNQELGGFTLVAVNGNSVTFESDGERVILRLKSNPGL